jgi:MtN3 and saliva related transmembrane protein
MNWELIGFFGAACTTFCFIPQLIKAWKTKELDDFAYPYLAVLGIGVLGWFIYGLGIGDRVVISANAITLTFVISLILMKISFKNK